VVYLVGSEFMHQDKFAAVGENVTIPCHQSNSTPVRWQFKNSAELDARGVYNGQRLVGDYVNKCTISSSTYELTIYNLNVDDAGEYWCTEDKGFGTKHVTKLFITGNILLLLHHCET